jgi:hypothetical protein
MTLCTVLGWPPPGHGGRPGRSARGRIPVLRESEQPKPEFAHRRAEA